MKTLLIVDDTKANLDILTKLLEEIYDLIPAISGEDALDTLQEEKVDLILLDIIMPGMDGFEVCKKIKKNPKTKEIPIIFITAKDDEESIEKAYDIGGSDYVTKPFKPKELKARIRRELYIQDLQNKLRHLAITDALTGLYNRRYFAQVSSDLFKLAKRKNEPLSIAILDIDHFKKINDTYGHHAGDKVIIHLAERITQSIRQSDITARYGGEEFVILLYNTSLEGGLTICESLRQKIANDSVSLLDGRTVYFTISIGVAEIDFFNETTIESALKRADDALYLSKARGRNCTTLASGEKPLPVESNDEY